MMLSNYLTSPNFYEALSPLKEAIKRGNDRNNIKIIEYMLSNAIIFSMLMEETNHNIDENRMNQFLYQTAKELKELLSSTDLFLSKNNINDKVRKYMMDALLEKKHISRQEAQTIETKTKLYKEVIKNLLENGYYFHACNSYCLDSIKNHGLDPTEKFASQEELDDMNKLFEKYQVSLIFGWQQLNCKGKVSYSTTPDVSYYYGISSPEWFSQFTGAGFPFNPIEKYDKYAFVKGDYESARKNLETLMADRSFSPSDQTKVISFFNRNWNIYANRAPSLVMIPHSIINPEKSDEMVEELIIDPLYQGKLESVIEFCTGIMGLGIDKRKEKPIATNEAVYVELPSYKTIMQELTKEQKETKFIEPEQVKDKTLQEKLEILMNAKIRIEKTPNHEEIWVSDNSEEELEQVKQILEDPDTYQAILTNPDNFHNFSGWLYYFSQEIRNQEENVKLLAVNAPILLSLVSKEKREDKKLMREVSSQSGISPSILYFVGEELQNDFDFVINIIENANSLTFDFYMPNEEGATNLKYHDILGQEIKENGAFWSLLNAKIDTLNRTGMTHIPNFDVEKELSLAKGSKGKRH